MSTTSSSTLQSMGPQKVTPAGNFDLASVGYAEEEFRFEGVAQSYAIVGDRGPDGRWQVEKRAVAPFTTRLIVRRPTDATRHSGTVVVEWLNVSLGTDTDPEWVMMHRHLRRRGDVWVGVSAQAAGLQGGGLVEGPHLKKVDPDRYRFLDHPGDAWSFDMFSQAGRAVRESAGTLGFGPVERLLAAGVSQSARYLVTYVNAVDPSAKVYDGFLLHGRGAHGAPIDGPSSPEDRARLLATTPAERIRDDVRVPTIVYQTETDVAHLGSGRADQADGPRLRLWELAGAAHADSYMVTAGREDSGALPAARLAELLQPTTTTRNGETDTPINAGPQHHYVAQAVMAHLDRWVAGGSPPPTAPRLDATSDRSDFTRDEHGITKGGVRTPWVDVPTAALSGLGQTGSPMAALYGTTVPFDAGHLAAVYPGGLDEYRQRFATAVDEAIAVGFLLAEDRDEIIEVATAAYQDLAGARQ